MVARKSTETRKTNGPTKSTATTSKGKEDKSLSTMSAFLGPIRVIVWHLWQEPTCFDMSQLQYLKVELSGQKKTITDTVCDS